MTLIFDQPHASAAPHAVTLAGSDLQTILTAWNEATDRLQLTHEALRSEVRRLTDELEAKNRELARRNRLADLGQMASHVAHEVRNGLVPTKLYLSLLLRRLGNDASGREIGQSLAAALQALETIVGDLLHFSSHREPQRSTVELAPLVSGIVDSLRPQFDAQGITVQCDIPQNLQPWADPDMLRRAILNLTLNALDVMPIGGELVITACRTRLGCEIEVADSGPGISATAFNRLFEPFYTTKSKGTGLGLAIVERLVEAHGGQILAANCPEGGAAFTLCLPNRDQSLLAQDTSDH